MQSTQPTYRAPLTTNYPSLSLTVMIPKMQIHNKAVDRKSISEKLFLKKNKRKKNEKNLAKKKAMMLSVRVLSTACKPRC